MINLKKIKSDVITHVVILIAWCISFFLNNSALNLYDIHKHGGIVLLCGSYITICALCDYIKNRERKSRGQP